MMDDNLTLRDHKAGDEIFQHDEGVWNISAIREGIASEPETFIVIDMELPHSFIHYCKLNIGVNIKRARALTIEKRDNPGIVIMREKPEGITLFMIDGHHRAIRLWRDGIRTMKVHIIAKEVGEFWRIKKTLILKAIETSEGQKIQLRQTRNLSRKSREK